MKRPLVNRRDFLRTGAGAGAAVAGMTYSGLGIAASAQDSAPPADIDATLSVATYGGDAEQTIFSEAVARFNERYPNVTVELNFTPVSTWGDYANKIITQAAGGKVPDVIRIAIEGIRLFASKELLEPLDAYITEDQAMQQQLEDTAQSLKDGVTVEGKLYIIPQGWNNMVIYYNTRLFSEAGLEPPKPDWSWDDFLNAAKALTTGEGDSKVYGLALPWGGMFQLMPWWLTNGTYPLNEDWTASNLDDPKIVEAIAFIHDLIHVHEVAPTVQGTDAGQLFAAGKVAMSGWGHWVIPTLKAAEFQDYDIQYWPRQTAATTVYGMGGFGLSPQAENKDLAWELVKDLSGSDVQQGFVTYGNTIPAMRSIAETPEFLDSPPNAEIFYASLDDSRPVASPANFNEFEQIVIRHVDAILSGGTSPEDGMKSAHEELEAAMQRL